MRKPKLCLSKSNDIPLLLFFLRPESNLQSSLPRNKSTSTLYLTIDTTHSAFNHSPLPRKLYYYYQNVQIWTHLPTTYFSCLLIFNYYAFFALYPFHNWNFMMIFHSQEWFCYRVKLSSAVKSGVDFFLFLLLSIIQWLSAKNCGYLQWSSTFSSTFALLLNALVTNTEPRV